MADTSPVIDQPVVEKTNEPVQHGDRARVDSKSFIGGFLLLVVLLLGLITIISGRWIKSRTINGSTSDIGLWTSCTCTDPWVGGCSKFKSLLLASEAFSVIALGFEFFTVIILFKDPINESKGLGHAATFLSVLAAISLLLTWAIFGAAYDKTFCNVKLRDSATLNWAYGIRVAEFALWTILTIVLIGNSSGKIKRNRTAFFFAFVIFSIGIITTSSRGWIKARPEAQVTLNTNATFAGGLWQNCLCVQNVDLTGCLRRVHIIRAAEAFAVGSIVLGSFLFVLLSGWIPATPKSVVVTVAVAAWFAQILTWVLVASYFSRQYCHTRLRNGPEGYKLHWGFGVQVALSAIMIPVVIISLTREYRL